MRGECTASYSLRWCGSKIAFSWLVLLQWASAKVFRFLVIYCNITCGAMVSRKHWLRMPLDNKQDENIRLTVSVGNCLPSCYRAKTNQNRPKILQKVNVKVLYDRQSWWRHKRYMGLGSARAVQEWIGFITIAEKNFHSRTEVSSIIYDYWILLSIY